MEEKEDSEEKSLLNKKRQRTMDDKNKANKNKKKEKIGKDY